MSRDDITVAVVSCLIREQFPKWTNLPIRPVELDGWSASDPGRTGARWGWRWDALGVANQVIADHRAIA